jgi:NAD(P)-dependent dehydrogenase (short-subunit alcohol dehydrogenase family)
MMNQTEGERGAEMDFGSVTSLKRMGESTEVADLIEFLLSDKSTFITGAVHNIDGGWI